MNKIFGFIGLILIALLLVLPTQVLATPYADWSVSHSYMADNVVSIGVGSPSSPLWSTVVQSYSWNAGGEVDISGGSSYLWGNQWYLQVSDDVGRDSGYIVNFDIRPGDGSTYISTDHPSIWDYHVSYAYVDMPCENTSVPEPATMLLLGFGLVGLVGAGRKITK